MSTPTTDSFAVLAEVAEAIADEERLTGFHRDPVSVVPGFDRLPEDLKATLKDMTDDELRAVGRMNTALTRSGFYVRNGEHSLNMF
jgi:hypothetical protein